MDQIEAIVGVLEACARLLRRMSGDSSTELGAELIEASTDMEGAARRLKDATEGQRDILSS